MMHVYNMSVVSILLYGLETWVTIQTLVRKIDAFDLCCLQMTEDVRWQEHVTNCEIWDQTQLPLAHELIARYHLHWF